MAIVILVQLKILNNSSRYFVQWGYIRMILQSTAGVGTGRGIIGANQILGAINLYFWRL